MLLVLLGVVCGSGQGKGGDTRTQDEEQEPEEGHASTTAHVLLPESLFVFGVWRRGWLVSNEEIA